MNAGSRPPKTESQMNVDQDKESRERKNTGHKFIHWTTDSSPILLHTLRPNVRPGIATTTKKFNGVLCGFLFFGDSLKLFSGTAVF